MLTAALALSAGCGYVKKEAFEADRKANAEMIQELRTQNQQLGEQLRQAQEANRTVEEEVGRVAQTATGAGRKALELEDARTEDLRQREEDQRKQAGVDAKQDTRLGKVERGVNELGSRVDALRAEVDGLKAPPVIEPIPIRGPGFDETQTPLSMAESIPMGEGYGITLKKIRAEAGLASRPEEQASVLGKVLQVFASGTAADQKEALLLASDLRANTLGVEILKNGLSSKHPEIRRDAMQELQSIPGALNYNDVMQGLFDKNPEVRIAAAEAAPFIETNADQKAQLRGFFENALYSWFGVTGREENPKVRAAYEATLQSL